MSWSGELRICEYNVENLFLAMEYYEGEDLSTLSEATWKKLALGQLKRRQKPLHKVQGVAKAILDIDADLYLLVEVGGRESLENFNRYFLADRYEAHFVEGNSRRSIDLGFLVRRGLGLRAETRSNRDTPVEVHSRHGKYETRFSRDVAELRLYDGKALRQIVLLTHLKSKLGSELDVQGKDTRTGEAIALAGVYERVRREQPGVPIVVGGDFNADIASLELELVSRTDLVDFHDVIGTPRSDRTTFVHVGFFERTTDLVLDYLLVSPELRDRVVAEKSFTYRYKGFYGLPHPLPQTMKERHQMPSDHFPVVMTIRV